MLIEAEHLSCGYFNKPILKDVSFRVEAGELWCILGPNGVGKTTLFKTLIGLLKQQSGDIYVDNKKRSSWNRKELAKRIAYVPQMHVPPFPFRVFDVVLMGRSPHLDLSQRISSKDIEAAENALELLNISYLYDKPYTEISGGERQLVLIARAIAQETRLLVMDEPASGLDFGNQIKVIEHIRNLVRKGRSVIMTTHFPDNAFLPESKVIILGRDGYFKKGKGKDIVTEEVLKELYHVDSKVVPLKGFPMETRICVPIYRS